MYFKTDAIVIQRRPIMNTSLVLRCYTARAGGVTVLAKGANRRRRKDEPPSVPDLFQRGEVVLWFGPRRDVAILREWSLDDMRRGIRDDYDAFRAACACSVVVNELSRDVAGDGEYYRMLDEALCALDAGGAPRPVVWSFVLRALAKAGFVAPLGTCASCGRAFGTSDGGVLSPADGGLICSTCANAGAPDPGARLALPPEALGIARYLAGSPVDAASNVKVSPRCSSALDRATVMLAEYHLERPMEILLPEARAS